MRYQDPGREGAGTFLSLEAAREELSGDRECAEREEESKREEAKDLQPSIHSGPRAPGLFSLIYRAHPSIDNTQTLANTAVSLSKACSQPSAAFSAPM